jgi:hypothetical protein
MNAETLYNVATRFPTDEKPEGEIRETRGLSLERAMLKINAILDFLSERDWEIDEYQTGGQNAWVVSKLGVDGYTVGSVVISA